MNLLLFKKNNFNWILLAVTLAFVAYLAIITKLPSSSQEQKIINSLNKSIPTIDGKTRVFGALNEARVKLGSPFLANLVIFINKAIPGSTSVLRLPGFFAFLGTLVVLYYFLLNYLKLKKILFYLLLILVSGFSFWAALRISPLVYFIFFSILMIFLGLKFFHEKEINFWQALGLVICFLIFPTIHYLSLVFILLLDLILLIAIMFNENKLAKIGQLFLLNLFLIIPLSTWSDVYYKYFTTLQILK